MGIGLNLGMSTLYSGKINGLRKALNIVPDRPLENYPLINFTRSSEAWAYNENGILQKYNANESRIEYDPVTGEKLGFLIEEGRTNLYPVTEDFERSEWSKTASAQIITSTHISPEGKVNADTLTCESGTESFLYDFASVTSGLKYTISFFVKSAGNGNDNFAIYGSGAGNSPTYTATDKWVRYTHTFTAPSTGAFDYGIRSLGNALDIVIWGAQLEQGSFATSYIQSTINYTGRSSTATYFDENGVLQTASINELRDNNHAYIDGEWIRTGLLLEGSSTNLISYSEDFTNSWIGTSDSSVTANTNTAPDSELTADTLTDSDSSNACRFTESISVPDDDVMRYASVFIRKESSVTSYPVVQFVYVGGATVTGGVVVDTVNGTLTNRDNEVPDESYIEDVGDYWKVTVGNANNLGGNTTCRLDILPAYNSDGSGTQDVSVTGSVVVWGAEVKLDRSSYIPTSGSQVTRSDDVYSYAQTTRSPDIASIEGSNFTDFYNQGVGSFVASYRLKNVLNGVWNRVFEVSDGTANNVFIHSLKGNQVSFYGAESGSIQWEILSNETITSGDKVFSGRVNQDDVKYFLDAIEKGSDSIAQIPTVNKLSIGRTEFFSSGRYLNGYLKSLSYYTEALSDTQLEQKGT